MGRHQPRQHDASILMDVVKAVQATLLFRLQGIVRTGSDNPAPPDPRYGAIQLVASPLLKARERSKGGSWGAEVSHRADFYVVRQLGYPPVRGSMRGCRKLAE
jgi:hypothetical protein